MNWLKQLIARRQIYGDLSQEIQEHLQEKVEELVASGMKKEDAVATARREFGNVLLLEEQGRKVWTWSWLENSVADGRFALRQLARNPGFTLIVLLTLTLAISLTTAMFTVVDALLLRPLPYPEPERLGTVVRHLVAANESGQTVIEDADHIDGETWELVRDNVPALHAAVWSRTRGVNLQSGVDVRYVREQRVSAQYFAVLGTRMLLGRGFSEQEDRPGGSKVVVLGYDLWKTVFSARRETLGEQIRLKGEPYTVVGILAPQAPAATFADLWTPLRPTRYGEGSGTNYHSFVRLVPGARWDEAKAQLARLQPSIFKNFRQSSVGAEVSLSAIPLQEDLASETKVPVLVLMFAVSCVLLIACANLAALMLVRISRRTGELTTRIALGAGRAALLRQSLMEPFLLVLAGGAAGFFLAERGLSWLQTAIDSAMIPPGGFRLDGRILGFSLATALGSVLMIGILPALELRKLDLRSSMLPGTMRAQKFRTRQTLIAGEVMLTLLLLSGAGLLVRTLIHLHTLPPGFDATNVMSAQLSLDDARYRDVTAFRRLLRDSIDHMKDIPGVQAAAVGLTLPYERALNDGFKSLDGPHAGQQAMTTQIYVTPEYFRVLRIPLLAGRLLSQADTADTEGVAVVDQLFAQRFLGGPKDVGRHIKSGNTVITIVGIVANIAKVPGLEPTAPIMNEPTVYVPAGQQSQPGLTMLHVWFQPSWIVRTNGPIDGLPAAMQKALAQVDPSLPFAGFHSMKDMEALALQQQRVEVWLLGVLAGLALGLSLIGLYGLVSNLVVQRTREIGIRMALGSNLTRAITQIGRSGIVAVAVGMSAGLALAALLLRLVRSQLYGVRFYDPATLLVVCLLMILAAVIASFLPTLRIARIDPASTLRAE